MTAGWLAAQDGPAGRWTGTIEIPNQAMNVEIDLDKTAGGWIGSMNIPAQSASGLPLEAITYADGKCTFKIKGGPGGPTFHGTLSADGKSLSGDFTQGPGSFPFKLTRAGAAKVVQAKNSPPVGKEFLGTWEGTLDAGQELRLTITISNDATGAKAVMVSVDQGGAEITVSGIEQKDTHLTLMVSSIGGKYQGDLNAAGTEMSGTWSQGGNDLPLKLKRKGGAAAK